MATAQKREQRAIDFSEFNDPILSQAEVTKVNAEIRYQSESGKWNASLWGKNVTNQLIASNKTLGILLWGYPIYGGVEPPATYGVSLGMKV